MCDLVLTLSVAEHRPARDIDAWGARAHAFDAPPTRERSPRIGAARFLRAARRGRGSPASERIGHRESELGGGSRVARRRRERLPSR
jgi:hypothetical protein